jgi:hypothetical protein
MKDALGHGSNSTGAGGASSARTSRGLTSAARERVALRQRTDFQRYGGRKFGTLDAGRIEEISAHMTSTERATAKKKL